MAIRYNPNGTITVGLIEEEHQPKIVADVPFEEVKAKEEPKKPTKAKTTKKKGN